MTKKKCLLIAPLSFYSYSQYIKEELQRIGYEVALSNDEYPANAVGKVMGKLKIPLLQRITKRTIVDHFLVNKQYDVTLIIKGRGMSNSLIKEIKKVCPVVIGYTFDSLKYHPAPAKWMHAVDFFYTFDYRDAEKKNLEIVELFSSIPDTTNSNNHKYEISGIARNHSQRLGYIDSVLSELPHIKAYLYIYEQNMVTFLQNFLKNPLLYLKYRKHIHFKSLPYSKYIDVLTNSNFVIDFAHPYQSGITIRCYEALSCGAKIITNNPYVYRDNHFTARNTILFNKKENSNLLDKYKAIEHVQPPRHNRSIGLFVADLLRRE